MFSPASAQKPWTLSAVISPRSMYALFTSVISSSFRADGFKVRTTTPRERARRRRTGAQLAGAGIAGILTAIVFLASGGHGLAFSDDGTRLATCDSNGVVLVWDGTPLPEGPREATLAAGE